MNTDLKHLVRLRWYAAIGVACTFLMVSFLKVMPLWPQSLWLLLLYVLTNLSLYLIGPKLTRATQNEWLITFITLFDLVFLTWLIVKNGGAHNPFTILFIAICSLAAMNLPRWHLVLIIGFALGCLGVIYNDMPLMGSMPHGDALSHSHHQGHATYNFHLQGMWLANSMAVFVITLWIHFLRLENERISVQHQQSQQLLQNIEKIDSMGRLLAAAAHKLNTPLMTMQLAISELSSKSHTLSEEERGQWLDDLQKSLHQITSLFQTLKNQNRDQEVLKSENIFSYLEALTRQWADSRKICLHFEGASHDFAVSGQWLLEIRGGVEAILENAYQSAKGSGNLEIKLSCTSTDDAVVVSIADNGPGMDPETLAHAAEPLFTTRKKGTGLGLYLCHLLAQKLDGQLEIFSILGQGTEVRLSFSKKILQQHPL